MIAFFSDVFDGIIARELGVATANLRHLDSLADTAFYLAAAFAVWRVYPSAMTERVWALFAGFFSLLALGFDNLLVDAAVIIGIIADAEGLAISFVLTKWQADVLSIVHAFRLRGNQI